MKKSIIVCVIFLTFGTTVVKAQETGKHEVNLTYSDGIPMTFVDGFSDALSSAILGQKLNSKTTSSGNFGLGYRNQITERIRVGGDIAFQQEQTEQSDKNNKFIGKRTNRYLMVMPTIAFSYIKTDWLDFYGSAAAGVVLERYTQTEPNRAAVKDNAADFAFQVNPAGIRVGKKLGVFAEVGFGYRGIVSAGLNYKF
ncbi:outer membrane beta-barrel protein [Flavobacterium collinsii]|uniref:OMP_b-brl domain-containing protein n=1 Tax=Flavobacterium collinsii TaxID=1114861 RepID=A0A9W4XD25_9FLAO|nr:outer membrane beta-barrel protein [Flavobacterium collinsii]CAI2765691.1 OMP_b-brl domain-containing protein [Flavobacterium collinsii]